MCEYSKYVSTPLSNAWPCRHGDVGEEERGLRTMGAWEGMGVELLPDPKALGMYYLPPDMSQASE